MSKPELDIIRSPEAEAFLRSVTKGFYNQSFIGLWIYEVIGREWDELREWSEGMRTEIHPQTCTWSIGIWEWVYGFPPDETLTLEERRRRVLSRVFSAKPINPEVLRRGISATAGAEAEVKDFVSPYTFGVTLRITNNPIPLERILRYIYETKPAHLSVASVEVVFPKIESTIRIGGTAGNATTINVPLEADRYSFQDTLFAGGSAGAAATIGMMEGQDTFDFLGTLRTGGAVEAAASIGVAEGKDTFDFQGALRTGGAVGAETSIHTPNAPDDYDFQSAVRAGGSAGVEASTAIPAGKDTYAFQGGLYAGGSQGAQTTRPVPEDTSQPPATRILRTGRICTFISNLPPTKGE